MRVHVAFTPDESAAAPTGVVIDVIRATSTICQALASGYERVLCAAEVEEARALRNGDGSVTLGGERLGVRIDGFDLGNSPREYLEPRSPVLAMSTTNGTRAIVTAAARCELGDLEGARADWGETLDLWIACADGRGLAGQCAVDGVAEPSKVCGPGTPSESCRFDTTSSGSGNQSAPRREHGGG